MAVQKEKEKKTKFLQRIRYKYRLLIINDDTLEEKASMMLSPLNVFTWGGAVVLLIVLLVWGVIAYTPTRELIPGYADPEVKKNAIYNTLLIDSLEQKIKTNERFLQNFRAIVENRPMDSISEQQQESSVNNQNVQFHISKEDSALRSQIESEDKYNLFYEETADEKNISSFFFFTPLKGLVSSSFNLDNEHYGVDVIAGKNEAVKSVLDGTVVLATWTSETGYIIQLQHENNLVSVYKHNSVLLKKAGDEVKAGEAIAIIGESGELTSGPHLHFELWYNGKPIDPQNYMIF
ncbi:MAG: peptidase M23 [Flavobacteriales bacterium]|nr:MAG: peptidase M23 [Flavobacteriales bacterium]